MKQQYRITNWKKYNRNLIDRGNIFLYFSPQALANWHNGGGKIGRPREYSLAAIEIFLTLRVLLHLPLRQTQGFIEGLIKQMGLSIVYPNYSLACRRAVELKQKLNRFLQEKGAVHILVDSSGLKIFGEGEWKIRTHGKGKRRTWRKIHISINSETKTVVACAITKANIADKTQFKKLLKPVPEVASCTGDGGYDSSKCYEQIKERGAKPIIPPSENAVVSKRNQEERNAAVEFIKEHGDNEGARTLWKQSVDYHKRSRVENTFYRLKTILGASLRSREFHNQEVEGYLRCQILNRMTAIGMPISVRVN